MTVVKRATWLARSHTYHLVLRQRPPERDNMGRLREPPPWRIGPNPLPPTEVRALCDAITPASAQGRHRRPCPDCCRRYMQLCAEGVLTYDPLPFTILRKEAS